MRALIILPLVLSACVEEPAEPAEPPCATEIGASGAVELDWDGSTDLKCSGYGPSIGGSVDLYWRQSYTSLRVRVDWIQPGDTGTFEETHISIGHQGEEWGSFDPVSCIVALDRHESIGKDRDGFRVYAVEGRAECSGPLEPFQSEGTVTITPIFFEGGYSQ